MAWLRWPPSTLDRRSASPVEKGCVRAERGRFPLARLVQPVSADLGARAVQAAPARGRQGRDAAGARGLARIDAEALHHLSEKTSLKLDPAGEGPARGTAAEPLRRCPHSTTLPPSGEHTSAVRRTCFDRPQSGAGRPVTARAS